MDTIPSDQRITEIMTAMGCKEVRAGIFVHPDVNIEMDMSATHHEKVLYRLAEIFANIGYRNCQADMRRNLGFE